MEYEIYLDMFFLVNFYMDYMIMWAVTKILKITQHVYIRRIGAAAVGALYATLIIAFRLNGAVWKIMTYAVIVLLMSFILTGKKKIRQMCCLKKQPEQRKKQDTSRRVISLF